MDSLERIEELKKILTPVDEELSIMMNAILKKRQYRVLTLVLWIVGGLGGLTKAQTEPEAKKPTEKIDLLDGIDTAPGFLGTQQQKKGGPSIEDLRRLSEFDEWLTQYRADRSSVSIATGKELALVRAEIFRRLVSEAPAIVIEKAISPETYRTLPLEISSCVEKPVSFYGDLEVNVIDMMEPAGKRAALSRTDRFVVIDGTRHTAIVYGRREAMTTKHNIPLSGVKIGDIVVLDESPVRRLGSEISSDTPLEIQQEVTVEIGGVIEHFASEEELQAFIDLQVKWESTIGPTKSQADGQAGPQSAWTTGPKTVLYMRVDFSDMPGVPVDFDGPLTEERVQNLFSQQVNPFFVDNSYNKTSLHVSVTPVLRLPHTFAYYSQFPNYTSLPSDARTVARAMGFESNDFSRDIVAFNRIEGLGWSGLALLGSKTVWLNGFFDFFTTSHELGHTYGLDHANRWQTTDGTIVGSGNLIEYGDSYDVMGFSGPLGHFNASYKRKLDWLVEQNVQTVTASGVYRIFAHDSPIPIGIRTLKIRKDSLKSYWVEFRQLFTGYPNAMNGAFFRWEAPLSPTDPQRTWTLLLDMTPETNGYDQALYIGNSFVDDQARLRFTVLGKGNTTPESLDIRVELNYECTFNISQTPQTFPASGGEGSLQVGPSGCRPTATTSDSWITVIAPDYSGIVRYIVAANSSGPRAGTITIAGQALTIRQAGPNTTLFDYDGDGKTDHSVFRPSTGAWYLQQSTAGFFGLNFGASDDRVTPADYDGDGKTDVAVYRPSTGIWYVTNSADGIVTYHAFGIEEDLPSPADYDGDGKADISVFRPSTGTWYRTNSSDGSFAAVQFGQDGDRPTLGDFDGDGKADVAVFRPSTGAWYQFNSSDGSFFGEQFGNSTDKIAPADYDGDGKTDIGIYRPSEGLWYYKNSGSGIYTPYVFGLADDIPVAGDYDGDGKADVGVFRPSDGYWYIVNSSNGSYTIVPWGQNGDIPTPNAFGN